MNPISAFFVRNIIAVFFLYGLAFFAMGLALALASRRTSAFRFAQAIRPLAVFGILHGIHEWIEMYQKIATLTGGYTPTVFQEILRLATLVISFLMLLAFGVLLLSPAPVKRSRVLLPLGGMSGLWLASTLVVTTIRSSPPDEVVALADVFARYSLGVPGALLGTWALMTQQYTFRKHGMPQFGRDLVWCATAMFLYGVVGQIFVRQTPLVPSTIINSTLFLQWFGIPVQLFRGVMAAVLAFYMVRALNAFELENQRRLEEANQARLAAQAAALEAERRVTREMERLNEELRKRQKLLGELLHQAVGAQEAERRRIARELHDATGQSLTAIALGLRGVESILDSTPALAARQIGELKSFSTEALGELRRIIADLRPSQLDDLGLVPALRWYLQEFEKRYAIPVDFSVEGTRGRLPPEYETVLFRIVQEALTNTAKHARASQASVSLSVCPAEVAVTITDDGCGFDVQEQLHNNQRPGWGLLGIQERASLLGGQCELDTAPGRGTTVRVHVPLITETNDAEDTTAAG